MFQHLVVVGHTRVHGFLQYKAYVNDSCFQETIYIRTGYVEQYDVVIEIIKLYKRKNRNIIPNLVAYYKYLIACGTYIRYLLPEDHAPNIDYVEKNLQFSRLYLPILMKSRLAEHFRNG